MNNLLKLLQFLTEGRLFYILRPKNLPDAIRRTVDWNDLFLTF